MSSSTKVPKYVSCVNYLEASSYCILSPVQDHDQDYETSPAHINQHEED